MMKVAIICPQEIELPLVGYGGIERIAQDLFHEILFNTPPGEYSEPIIFCRPKPDAGSLFTPYPKDPAGLDKGQDLTIDFTHEKAGRVCPTFTKKNYIAMCLLTDARSNVNDTYFSRAVAEGLGDPQGRVVYGGIDPRFYHYQDKKEPYLLFLGRVAKIKRVDIAILVAKRTRLKLVVAGHFGPYAAYPDPGYPDMIKAWAKREPGVVTVVEDPTQDQKSELLEGAAALVMPSEWALIGTKESFGITAVEALMCGTPVICSGEGGPGEIVGDSEKWVGASCTTLDEYVDVVKSIMAMGEHSREQLARACRERGLYYTSERLLRDLVAYWRECQ